MTQLQKWIFLAEETKTRCGFRGKDPLAAMLCCHLKNGMFCQKRCFQPFLLALDLETRSLMWKADLGLEDLPLGVHPFKAKAILQITGLKSDCLYQSWLLCVLLCLQHIQHLLGGVQALAVLLDCKSFPPCRAAAVPKHGSTV